MDLSLSNPASPLGLLVEGEPDFDQWLFQMSCDEDLMASLSDPSVSSPSSSTTMEFFHSSSTSNSKSFKRPAKTMPCKKASTKKFRPTPSTSPSSRRIKTARGLRVIPSDDSRRRLPTLLINAVNQGEPEALQQLLREHCAPQVVLSVQRCDRVMAGEQLEVRGLDAVLVLASVMMNAVPDGVVQLRTTKVTPLPEDCCSITFGVGFSGCKVVDLVGDEGNVVMVPAPAELRSDPLGDGVLAYTMQPGGNELVPECVPVERLCVSVRANPALSKGTGRLTLLLDAEHRISKVHLLHSLLTN